AGRRLYSPPSLLSRLSPLPPHSPSPLLSRASLSLVVSHLLRRRGTSPPAAPSSPSPASSPFPAPSTSPSPALFPSTSPSPTPFPSVVSDHTHRLPSHLRPPLCPRLRRRRLPLPLPHRLPLPLPHRLQIPLRPRLHVHLSSPASLIVSLLVSIPVSLSLCRSGNSSALASFSLSLSLSLSLSVSVSVSLPPPALPKPSLSPASSPSPFSSPPLSPLPLSPPSLSPASSPSPFSSLHLSPLPPSPDLRRVSSTPPVSGSALVSTTCLCHCSCLRRCPCLRRCIHLSDRQTLQVLRMDSPLNVREVAPIIGLVNDSNVEASCDVQVNLGDVGGMRDNKPNGVDSRGRRPYIITRCARPAKMYVNLKDEEENVYYITQFTDIHNHALCTPTKTRRLQSHKKLTEGDLDVIAKMKKSGIGVARSIDFMRHDAGGLLFSESIDDFKWLFETWLHAMGGVQPKTIITDQDAAIVTAIATGYQQETEPTVDASDNFNVQFDRSNNDTIEMPIRVEGEHGEDQSLDCGYFRWVDGGSVCSQTKSHSGMEKIKELESDFGELVGCVSELKNFQMAEFMWWKLASQAELRQMNEKIRRLEEAEYKGAGKKKKKKKKGGRRERGEGENEKRGRREEEEEKKLEQTEPNWGLVLGLGLDEILVHQDVEIQCYKEWMYTGDLLYPTAQDSGEMLPDFPVVVTTIG
ncbi:hypothetical protein ACLOJK_022532, partial [Asimina triloba]